MAIRTHNGRYSGSGVLYDDYGEEYQVKKTRDKKGVVTLPMDLFRSNPQKMQQYIDENSGPVKIRMITEDERVELTTRLKNKYGE